MNLVNGFIALLNVVYFLSILQCVLNWTKLTEYRFLKYFYPLFQYVNIFTRYTLVYILTNFLSFRLYTHTECDLYIIQWKITCHIMFCVLSFMPS